MPKAVTKEESDRELPSNPVIDAIKQKSKKERCELSIIGSKTSWKNKKRNTLDYYEETGMMMENMIYPLNRSGYLFSYIENLVA